MPSTLSRHTEQRAPEPQGERRRHAWHMPGHHTASEAAPGSEVGAPIDFAALEDPILHEEEGALGRRSIPAEKLLPIH